jgi:MFS family permease
MAPVTYSSLLRRNHRFRNLWAGQVVSELGNWFNFIAELGLARALSGSAWAATGIMIAHLVPFCVLGPVAGALADRLPRRTLMIASDLLRAVVALGFCFVTSPELLPLAYVCAAIISGLGAFFEAAKNAAMPNLARNEELLTANSLMHATRFLQMTVGALLGGLASDAFGHQAAFAINAASYVLSAAFVATIPAGALVEDGRTQPTGGNTAASLARDLREAFAFMRRNTLVLGLVALNVGWALGGGMITLIADRFGGRVFAADGQSGDRGVAILYAASGAGLCLGMLIARRLGPWMSARERLAPYIGWSIAAAGLLFAVGGLMPGIWLMAAVWVVNRCVLSAEFAVQETVLMNALPDSLRGKVFTIDRSLEVATMAVSAVIGGWLFGVLPPTAVAVISGVLMALPGLAWLIAVRHGGLRVPRAALDAPHALEPRPVPAD